MGHHSVLSFISGKSKMMMLKQLFALALLSTSVYGRFAPSERQLEAGADQGTGDEWQYCEDKCDETCKECEDHHVCEDGEIECAEGKDNNGCEKQPICKAKGRGNNNVICEGYCDEVCPGNTNTCQQPPDEDGCATKDACEPKQVDNNGNYCDEQHCKLTCSIEDQLCEGETIDGCKEADVCVPKQTNENSPDGLCPGTCPVECQNGWILCTGQIDYYGDVHKGCKAQDICVVC